jgi:hypothetical protein
MEFGLAHRSSNRSAVSAVMIGVCLLAAGCATPTVWKAETRSPDGHWVAIARTVESGGFGNAWIITSVSLQQNDVSQPPTQVLAFSCEGPVPRPYVLDNVANAGGTIGLKMKWVTPSLLEVTYDGHPDVYFQVVKYRDIHISLQGLPDERTSTSR